MKWFTIIYDTIWFRCHPITGPVGPDDPSPVIYPTWRGAFGLARMLAE